MITRVYAIPARELMKLNGIQDKTLFYRNVRYGLGITRVNREIRKTIKDTSKHDKFFLFHNGITLVCDKLVEDGNSVELTNYSVINGCQSMITLYESRDMITDGMQLLAKVIQLDQTSDLVADITYYTNNQNPIRLQDLRADDRVHKGIQAQFTELLDKQVLYKRKRGESEDMPPLSNWMLQHSWLKPSIWVILRIRIQRLGCLENDTHTSSLGTQLRRRSTLLISSTR